MIKLFRPVFKKRYFRDAFWSNLNQLFLSIFFFAFSILLARYSGQYVLGFYLFIMALFGFLSVVAIPGTRTMIIKCVSKNQDKIYSKATKLSFLYSLIGIPILIFIGGFYFKKDPALGFSLIFLSLFFPFYTGLQTWNSFLKGKGKFKLLTKLNGLKFVTELVILFLLVFYIKNAFIIVLIYLLLESFFNLCFYFLVLPKKTNGDLDNSWKKNSFYLTIMDISSIIFGKADLIIVGSLLSVTELAIYGIVMKIIDLFLKMIKSSVESILPRIYGDPNLKLKSFYRPFLLCVIISIFLSLLIGFPIKFFYGASFSSAIFLSRIYLFSLPLYFVMSVTNNFLIKFNLTKEINYIRIASSVIVIFFYLILIPLFGLIGGVIASLVYLFFNALMNLVMIFVKKIY